MPYRPKERGLVPFVEGILGVNQQEAPVFLFLVQGIQGPCGIYASFDSNLETSTELFFTTGVYCLLPSDLQVGNQPPPGFSNFKLPDACALV